MKIAIIGATGSIGQEILAEAQAHRHEVTVISRHPETVSIPGVRVVQGDALDSTSIAQAAQGQDVIISTVAPLMEHPANVVEAAHALIEGVKQAGGPRLIVVGGAGSLEVAPGVLLFDTPEFPDLWRPMSRAHGDALNVYKASDIDWTFFCPAGIIDAGERTGSYRLGTDQLLTDAEGKSFISRQDFAVALLDEIEQPQFIRRRFTAAY